MLVLNSLVEVLRGAKNQKDIGIPTRDRVCVDVICEMWSLSESPALYLPNLLYKRL